MTIAALVIAVFLVLLVASYLGWDGEMRDLERRHDSLMKRLEEHERNKP